MAGKTEMVFVKENGETRRMEVKNEVLPDDCAVAIVGRDLPADINSAELIVKLLRPMVPKKYHPMLDLAAELE